MRKNGGDSMPNSSLAPLPGDLLFVRGTDWIGRDIERLTHNTYSHVAIFTGPNELIEAQGFRKVGYQDAGVYGGISDIYRCDSLSQEDRVRIVNAAKKHIGEHYDYPLLAVEMVRYTTGLVLPWYEFHAVICSTLVADCYRAAGREPCPGISNPSPADLALSRIFHKFGAFAA